MNIVRIALDIPLPTLFDYTVAEGVEVATGQRVIVPFGQRQLAGVVMECAATTDVAPERIKPVTQVLYDSAPLSSGLLGPAALLQRLLPLSDRPDGIVRITRAVAFRQAGHQQTDPELSLDCKRRDARPRGFSKAKSSAAAHPGQAGGTAVQSGAAQGVVGNGGGAVESVDCGGWVESFASTPSLTLSLQGRGDQESESILSTTRIP